jgi:5-methyltetrahydropteroyltriglutamate--homocysteine methyltransferase
MSTPAVPPFRADHVGSLLRPPELVSARRRHRAGECTDAELRAVEDTAIRASVAQQEALGLQAVTDGEFRRAAWHTDFIFQIGGISRSSAAPVRFRNDGGEVEFSTVSVLVDGKLGLEHTIFGDDFTFLASVATTGVPKLTIPAPSMVHYRGGPAVIDRSVYPDVEQFWSDLGATYAEEVRRLAAMGCRYLQFDDTSLAYLNDPKHRAEIAGRGEDADHMHLRYIRQTNAALAGRPDGMAVTTHLCRGNFRSSWAASGGYEFVAEALFTELAVDGFFLEYDDERSGGFEPLRFLPADKFAVLGLVTSKRPDLESKDDLKQRIDEAARYADLDQLCLSPQCGFSSTEDGNALSADEQKAKLELVLETAAEVWT